MKFIWLPILLAGIWSCRPAQPATVVTGPGSNPVVAHRGAFKIKALPENSIAALQEAIRLGCAGSEFDVRMSADDSLVVNHDPAYRGMDIEKTSYELLASLPLPNGETLPTLRSYLMAGKGKHNTLLVLELKPSPAGIDRGKRMAEKALALVRETGLLERTVFISFDLALLTHLRQLNTAVPLQYLNGDKTPAELAAAGIDGLDYHVSVFRKHPEWIAEARREKRVLNAWTVNDTTTLNWLLDQGFDYITTNEPGLLMELWRGRAVNKK